MDHEAQVGLVEPHAQRAGGHQHLQLVREQRLLQADAVVVVGGAAVGLGLDALAAQERGHPLAVGDREHVDDARAVEPGDRLGEPRHALGLAGHVGHGQRQALAVERAAVGAQRRAELVGDVGDHAVVRGGGGAEHGHVGGQRLEHAHDAPVVRTEVVAPVADAVRLVDHQQADRARDDAEHLVAEALVREPLGRDQQQVDLVVGQALHDRLELVGVRRVDRLGAHADARGHLDLVAHQRQQGRHEQRGTGALLAQQLRGDEVDGGLAPPGALDEEDAASVAGDGLDRLELPGPEGGVGAEHLVEVGEGSADVWHARTVLATGDIRLQPRFGCVSPAAAGTV